MAARIGTGCAGPDDWSLSAWPSLRSETASADNGPSCRRDFDRERKVSNHDKFLVVT
ncbi:MAG TPA: hypothetical protein VKU00_04190 [Chthonomonadaceae bacterium]|nr:hypothetical protein [Chthonomonadaceae bacterium]